MGYLQGDWIPHPNSLLFNFFPPFWGLKAFWLVRKVSRRSSPKRQSTASNNFVMNRPVNSSSFKTSPRLPRVTPTNRDLAGTSALTSTTEHDENRLSHYQLQAL